MVKFPEHLHREKDGVMTGSGQYRLRPAIRTILPGHSDRVRGSSASPHPSALSGRLQSLASDHLTSS